MDRMGVMVWQRSLLWSQPLLGALMLAIATPCTALQASVPAAATHLSKFEAIAQEQNKSWAPAEATLTTESSTTISTKPDVEPAEHPAKTWTTLANPDPAVSIPDTETTLPESEATTAPPDTPSPPPTTAPPVATPKPPAPTPDGEAIDAATRRELLIEGDRLWEAGHYDEAERLYRKAKSPGEAFLPPADDLQPFSDPAQLSPEGAVYWREAQEGKERGQDIREMVGLELLVQNQPEFLPGQVQYAEALLARGRAEDALAAMEQVAGRFGSNPEVAQARIIVLAQTGHLLEASIAARQFALIYPNDPLAAEFDARAAEYLDEFKDDLREEMTANAIVNTLTSAISLVLTGNLYGPLTTLQTNLMLLEGEDAMGEAFSNQAADQLDLILDETVVNYVNDIGQRLARMTGRDEFEYEFFVVNNRELNAFALPGGKIFIYAGTILNSNSEAELAGVIAHELAHTVLSHGFELMLDSTLAGNTLQLLPYGGIISDLVLLRYSRDMERQADTFGTRLLATAGYAADGLHTMMETMERENPEMFLEWLSTHPDTDERLRNMAEQIQRNNYNIYAFEGVERHEQVRERLRGLIRQSEEEDE